MSLILQQLSIFSDVYPPILTSILLRQYRDVREQLLCEKGVAVEEQLNIINGFYAVCLMPFKCQISARVVTGSQPGRKASLLVELVGRRERGCA